MAAIDFLRKQWKEEAAYRPFHPYLHIDDDGLTLGAGTRLAPMIEDGAGASVLALSGQEERILALLSLAYRKRVSIKVIEFIKRASLHWKNGEKTLAHFELAYAQLPRFASRDEAKHLFYAEGLLSAGVSPRALMRSRDLDPRELDLVKYSPDQPRVPAGNGRENDAENGVFLPAEQHARLHTNAYYDAVNNTLANVKSQDEVIRILGTIKGRLKERRVSLIQTYW